MTVSTLKFRCALLLYWMMGAMAAFGGLTVCSVPSSGSSLSEFPGHQLKMTEKNEKTIPTRAETIISVSALCINMFELEPAKGQWAIFDLHTPVSKEIVSALRRKNLGVFSPPGDLLAISVQIPTGNGRLMFTKLVAQGDVVEFEVIVQHYDFPPRGLYGQLGKGGIVVLGRRW